MRKTSSRQQQVGEREALYSHHSLNMHSEQLTGTAGQKSAHTQPHGQTSQRRQPPARSSRRGQRTRLRTSAALVPRKPFPREVRHSSPRAQGPGTALVPHPPPRGNAEKAPSARLACIRPAWPAPSLTPSHAPEPARATTHRAPRGRGSPGRLGAAPPPRARQRGG